jgi:hypothetical protein
MKNILAFYVTLDYESVYKRTLKILRKIFKIFVLIFGKF